jgi:hypothetical protein
VKRKISCFSRVSIASPTSSRSSERSNVFIWPFLAFMIMNKVISLLVHFVPAGMLLLAIGRWPCGYWAPRKISAYGMMRAFMVAARPDCSILGL